MEGLVTEEDERSCEDLMDMMTRGDFDSISIEDTNRVLFHIVETFGNSSDTTSKLEDIYAAAKRDESAKSNFQEGKSIPNKDGVIPGFIVYEKDSIQILLDGIDLKDERYNTLSGSALHFALETKNDSLAEYLIEQGYPLYKENSDGLTPLDIVCKCNLNLKILLKAKIDINHVNSKGFESLHYALKYQNIEIAEKLIESKSYRHKTCSGLLEAIETGNFELINFAQIAGMTYDKCHLEMMEKGEFDNISIEDINLALLHFVSPSYSISTSKLKKEIFDAAAEKGESARRKLQEGKSIQTRIVGVIPGFIVKDKRAIEILLDGIDLKSECYNTHSGSALHFALETKNDSLAEYLIEQGYPLYKENSDGLTPLDTVCKCNLNLTILLKANIDIHHVNSKGFESLHFAIKNQNLETAKKLIKIGGDRYVKDYGFVEAVETGNLEMIKRYLQSPEPHSIERITDYLMELSVFYGNTTIMELLIEKGFQIEHSSLLKIAIVNKQLSLLLLLLDNKKEIDIDLKSLYSFNVLSDKDALITLPSLLKNCGSLESNMISEFIEELMNRNYYRCMKVFLKYLSENKDDISKRLLSDSDLLLKHANMIKSEDTFIVVIDFIKIEDIKDYKKHQIYHVLLDHKKYKCLKKLFDKMMSKKSESFYMDVAFLNSIKNTDMLNQSSHVDPKSDDYSISPTLLHKLNNCKDSKVRFHPVINVAVEKKLSKYRWWYTLTFVLYCIFLSSLYFALFNASYQCDDALFSYTGSMGALRAVCEVVVLIYGILFSIDESIEFAIIFIRFSIKKFDTKNLFKVLLKKNNGRHKNLRTFFKHLIPLIKMYFGIFNMIDILGLIFIFLLIIFRISSSPFQWTLASFTIIFFTLRLFKYTRNIPSLGAYVKTIFQIFKHDIIQFSVIVLIIILAYFGGIHLAARQTYISPDSTIVPPDNCSNNSFTGLFWFDQERTSSYDLRRLLLSGIIFLLDGGPGNEETELLDSNFLFSFLYLGFAFTIIVVMSNILIAQLSQTYAEVTKNSFLPFKFDLVVSVEYDSNLAFFFGKFLKETGKAAILVNPDDWKEYCEIDIQTGIIEKLEDNSIVLNHCMEKTQRDTKVTLESQTKNLSNELSFVKQDVKKEIGDVKQSICDVKLDLEKRMEHIEGMIMEVLSLLKQSSPTVATL